MPTPSASCATCPPSWSRPFRSTLEEVGDSDLLLHVVDASHPDPEGQITAVRTVLGEIDGFDVPEIVVLNKADIAEPETIARLRSQVGDSAVVSARTGMGIEELRELIAERLPRPAVEVDLVVPYSRGDLISRVHTTGGGPRGGAPHGGHQDPRPRGCGARRRAERRGLTRPHRPRLCAGTGPLPDTLNG